MRHTTGVILIAALHELFSQIQPLEIVADDVSFEVTFLLDVPLPEDLLPEIERQMVALIRAKPDIESIETLSSNAADYFDKRAQPLLAQQLRENEQELIPMMRLGGLMFPCETPHELDLSQIGAVKLLSIEHDSETGFSTISGTAFSGGKELRQFIKRRELAKTRDHRLIGQELQLFGTHQEEWFWLPRGGIIRSQLLSWWERETSQQDFTPISYITQLDPASAHARIYAASSQSYRNLPQRYCEIIEVRQPDGRPYGLFQTTAHQTDALTVFCRQDQVAQELTMLLALLEKTVSQFGLTYEIHVSGKYKPLHEILKQLGWLYTEAVSSTAQETTLEVHIEDALGRRWLGPQLTIHSGPPKQQKLTFQAADGDMRTPVQMTASLFSSVERFTGLLLEHFSGAMPLWLAPEQVRIIPITERHIDYSEQVRNTVADRHLRVACDLRRDTLSARVFAAENARVPFVLVVGDQEEREGCVTVRDSRAETITHHVSLAEFLQQVQEESGQHRTTHKLKP